MDRIDILNRDSFVEQLIQLVENIAEGKASASFAIDGSWGCGKSFVLDMFEEQLAQIQSEETYTDKYLIIRYNCWKYDYYEEPLIAIVATIIDAINEKTKFLYGEQGEKVKGVLKAVGTTLLSISHNAFKTATGIDASAVFDVLKSGIDTGTEEFEKMQEYDVLFGLKQTLHSLQDALNKISEQYTLVFLVDELDRCLPEYAVKVLERLHHLTENTKVVNIIAIDKKQLKTSIQHIFGFENADKYLKKFIQFSIPLDFGNASEKIVDKYSDYISLFDKTLMPFEDSVDECMQALFTNIDAREQEQLVQKAVLAHKLLYSDVKDYGFMCVELLILTVESCYEGDKVFTNWFQPFASGRREKAPPFSVFFNKKFSEVPHETTCYSGTRSLCEYIFQSTVSLYGAIAYTWYELFFKNSLTSILVSNGATRNLLDNNVIELKKFVETVKLIK